MVLPPVDGLCVVGASFDLDDADPAPRASSHAGNLERLERIISVKTKPQPLEGRVAFRIVAPDRLPLVGKLAEEIGRASCREKSVDLGGRRIIKKKKNV